MAFKPIVVKNVIDGKEYIAQFNGISAANKALDNAYIDGSSNTSNEKLAKYLFENVIVDPRLKIDDFGKDKIGTEESEEINGKVYKAKFTGITTALRAIDENYIEGTSNISNEAFCQYILDNVIVSPEGLTPDDFESADEQSEVIAFARKVMEGHEIMDEYNKVVGFARDVMQGKFRDSKDKGTTKKKG